jgi:hypothetical protein
MERVRGRSLSALWGGIVLGTGTAAYALFSTSSAGCSTNLVVLTRSTVTARGCAVFSVVSHIGVGLIVLGAVLLLGSFALAVRTRRQPAPVHADLPGPVEATAGRAPEPAPAAPVTFTGSRAVEEAPPPTVEHAIAEEAPSSFPEPAMAWSPIAPGDDTAMSPGSLMGSSINLPPGWYGNPNNPGRSVQWWDGTKLTDRPG